MASSTAARRRHTPWALPAVVLTTVAATFGATPAVAAEKTDTRDTRPLLRPGATPVAATAPAGGGASVASGDYTVVDGDTPYDIAQRFGLSVDALLSMNGLSWSSVIYPGDVLAVTATVLPAAPVEAPSSSPAVSAGYEVVAGDTMYAIAEAHGITLDTLFAANALGPDSIIYPGQMLALSLPAPVLAAAPDAAPTVLPDQWATLDAEQTENAQLIIAIGRELGVSDHGVAIALATAMVESWLCNLDWGDRDSLGLFQQRPSTGWGTAEQILDRDRSIRVFFGGAADPNGAQTSGLLDIDGWDALAFADAAQAVQISAFPARYGAWEAQAHQWLAELG